MDNEEIIEAEDDFEYDNLDDLEPEAEEEQQTNSISNHELQNRFFQNSYNPINQNRFSNHNKNEASDRFLKNNIGKQAKPNPPKINSANSKNIKNSASKGSNSKINTAKNIINSIQKNKSQGQKGLNESEDSENKKNVSGKNAAKDAVDQLKQGGETIAKKVVSKVITSRTGIPKMIADKLADFAVGNGKKIIAGLATCGLLLVFLFVSVFADDEDDSDEDKNYAFSSYYSGNSSDEELFNSLGNSGFIEDDTCMNAEGDFDESCSFITFVKKIKDNTATSNDFMYVLYSISYERELEEYIDNTEELDALLNNSSNLESYLNGDYLSTYRNDLPESFDLYDEISQIVSSSNYSNYSGDEFEIDSDTGFVMRISRAQRENKFYYSKENIEFKNSYEGECVWYAEGRANEIMANWGLTEKYTALGNGGEFCQRAANVNYVLNKDVDKIEQGSIISWMYGTYGHVAIVEKVNKDYSGKVTSIVISQGGLGFYNPTGKNSFTYMGNTILTSSFIGNNWGFVNQASYGGTKAERRKAWCEAFDTGCQSIGQILSGNNIKNFGHADATSWCTIPLSQFK